MDFSCAASAPRYWAETDGPPSFGELVSKTVAHSGCRASLKADAVLQKSSRLLDRSVEGHAALHRLGRGAAKANMSQALAKWAQLQLTRFQWIHCDVLASMQNQRPPLKPALGKTVGALQRATHDLDMTYAEFAAASAQLQDREQKILQRLAWAKNSNKAAAATWELFTSRMDQRQGRVSQYGESFRVVKGISSAVTHLET